MMKFIFNFIILVVLMAKLSKSAPSLLGVGGSGGGSGSGLIGSSFNFDTSDKRLTRLHGTGVKVDLDLLEINAAGGILRYTPTHIEWEKGNAKWQNTFSESKVSIHYNDRAIIQLYTPDESPHYFLSVFGNAGFNDIILDQQSSLEMLNNLCLTELSTESGESSQSKTKCTLKMRDTHLSIQQTFDYQSKVILETARKMMTMSRKTDDTAIKMTNMENEKQNEVNMINKLRIDISEVVTTKLEENNVASDLKIQDIVNTLKQYKGNTEDNITNVNISLVNITNWIELMVVDINHVIVNLNNTYSNNLLDLRRDIDNYDIISIQSSSQNNSIEIEKIFTNMNELTLLFDKNNNDTIDTMNRKFDSLNITIDNNLSHIMNIIDENVTIQNIMTLSIIKETNDTLQGLINNVSTNTDNLFSNFNKLISDNITTLSNDIMSNMRNIILLNDTLLEQIDSLNNSNIMQGLYNHRRLSDFNESISLYIDELNNINIKNNSDIDISLNSINGTIQSIIINVSDIHSEILNDLSLSKLELTTLINEFAANSSESLTRNNAILVHVIGDINQTIVEEKENTIEMIEKLSNNINNSLIQLRYDFQYNLTNSHENLTNYIINNEIQNKNSFVETKEVFTTSMNDLNDTITSEILSVNNNILSELNFTKSILLYRIDTQDKSIENLTNDIYLNTTRDNVIMNDNVNLVNSTLFESLDMTNNLLLDNINSLNRSSSLKIIELMGIDLNLKSQLDELSVDTNQSISNLSSVLNDSINNISISFQQQLDSNKAETLEKLFNITTNNNDVWNSVNTTIKLINYGMNRNDIELKDLINLNQVTMLLNVSELNRSTIEMNQIIKSSIEMNSLNINSLNSSLSNNITLLDLKMKNINELLQKEDSFISVQMNNKFSETNDTIQFLNKSIYNEISIICKDMNDSNFNINNQINNVSTLIEHNMNHMNNSLNNNIDNLSKTTTNSILKVINDANIINNTLINEIIYINNSILSHKNEMNITLENHKHELIIDKNNLVQLELNVSNKILALNRHINQSNTDHNGALIKLENIILQNISNLSTNMEKTINAAENKTDNQLNVLKLIIDRVIKTEQDDIKKLSNDLNITIDNLTSSIIRQMLDHSKYINNSNTNTLDLINLSNSHLKGNFTILSNDINKNVSDFQLNAVNILSNMKEQNKLLYDNLKERIGELYKEQLDTSKIVSNALIVQGIQTEVTKTLTDKIDLIDSNLKTVNKDVQNLLLNTTELSTSISILSKNSLVHDSFRSVINNKIDLFDSSIKDLEAKNVKSIEHINYLSKNVDDKYDNFEKINNEFKIEIDNINKEKNIIGTDLSLLKVNVKDNTDGIEKLEKNIESLSKKIVAIEDKLVDNKVNYDKIKVSIDYISEKLNTNDNNDNISRELQKEYNKQMTILQEKNIELQNKLEKQSLLVTSAETLINSQEKRIAALENESLKIRSDYASLESVDSLRKLLYEMQSNMVSHSSKVLDLIIAQKMSS